MYLPCILCANRWDFATPLGGVVAHHPSVGTHIPVRPQGDLARSASSELGLKSLGEDVTPASFFLSGQLSAPIQSHPVPSDFRQNSVRHKQS